MSFAGVLKCDQPPRASYLSEYIYWAANTDMIVGNLSIGHYSPHGVRKKARVAIQKCWRRQEYTYATAAFRPTTFGFFLRPIPLHYSVYCQPYTLQSGLILRSE